ncbi:MAG TPA: methyltransferase domain-containing protein, partial [Terriglobia bacterium]
VANDVAEKLRMVRERIQRRVERTAPPLPEMRLPALDPLKDHQRAARNLAAAIGGVNPRPPGLANDAVQSLKRLASRLLDWQIRPQRDYNRHVAESLAKITEALEQTGQALQQLRNHIMLQRWGLEGELMRQADSAQLFREHTEQELHLLRQRLAAQAKAQATRAGDGSAAPSLGERKGVALPLDYIHLENLFRGTEEEIRTRQSFYLPFFRGRHKVLDIACGRGEFLELMREAGVPARGVDLDADMVGRCLAKGLAVVQGDVFAHLESTPDGSLDGIFSAQFVEHLEAADYIRLIAMCARKLAPGGVLAIETQSPECLAIFSQSFFLDPTHVRPIPAAQLRFVFAEVRLERITTHYLSPAGAGLPLIPELNSVVVEAEALGAYNAAIARFNETFFGGMDYAVIGYRPAPDA